MRGQGEDGNDRKLSRLDRVRSESGEEDTWKTSEPFAGERSIRGRDWRDGVGHSQDVAREDEHCEPGRPRDDDPDGQSRDGPARGGEDQPKIAFTQEGKVSDMTPSGQRAGPVDSVRSASPVVDLVDRMSRPSLDQAAEAQRHREPQ